MAQGSAQGRVCFCPCAGAESGIASIGGRVSAADAEESGHRQEDQRPQAPAYLRHELAERWSGVGGHQDPAGP